MVKDVEKDEVIQGSDSAETVVHQVKPSLQSSFYLLIYLLVSFF